MKVGMVMDQERLIKERERKGWTKTETAKRLGIAGSTYSSYEYGHRNPDNGMLVLIANLFGVSTDYLLGNDNVESKDYFEEAEAIMFKDIEGFNELPPEKQQEIKDMINRQLKFFIEDEKRDS